ncbi:TrbC/VirB2 family protein [Peribacillus loiseleuriae]|uniref:TrbC/VirB2 family protein n=1 Tax=Peribacillus loiseleuriae TaxID=1679170 RepID=UPI003D00DA71
MKKSKVLSSNSLIKRKIALNKIFLLLGTMLFLSPVSQAFALTTDIYSSTDAKINGGIVKVIKLIGGVGGSIFTLAIMVIAVAIIFGSISAAKMRTIWISLISCTGGAVLFYSAWYLAPAIAAIAK